MSERLENVCAQDEGFWQQQEGYVRGQMGQPCCTLSGICSVLSAMRGNFAVVIHGERDCASSFMPSPDVALTRFFSTNLNEKNAIAGATEQVLEECLRAIADEVKPDVIFVLGTCTVAVLGERFEASVSRVSYETGIAMRALNTGGLRLGTQSDMLDWLFEVLAGLPVLTPLDSVWSRQALSVADQMKRTGRWLERARYAHDALKKLPAPLAVVRESAVNLVGVPQPSGGNWDEPEGLLRKAGLQINAVYPFGATLEDWRAVNSACVSAVADRSLYPRLTEQLERLDQRIVEVPLPVGLEQTCRFFRLIAEAFDKGPEMETHLEKHRERIEAEVRPFVARYRGLRMAMGIRMLNNYQADQLAYSGLGDAQALAEMGLELTLLVQGPDDAPAREQFATYLARVGCTLPFEVFPDPWILSERLSGGRFDVAYLAGHSREEAAKAGVPMIASRSLKPFFNGVIGNMHVMDGLLRQSGVGR